MAAKKFDHPLQLIVALSGVGEEGVVAASFAVSRLDGFLVRSQAHLKFTAGRLCERLDPEVFRNVVGAAVKSYLFGWRSCLMLAIMMNNRSGCSGSLTNPYLV